MAATVTLVLPASILSDNVRKGHFNIVKFLVDECNLSPNILTHSDVMSAVVNGYVKTFKFLLKRGINHILAVDDGWFFVWAASHNRIALAKLLVEKGADYKTQYDVAFCRAVDYNHQKMLTYIRSLRVENITKAPYIINKMPYYIPLDE